MNRRIFSTLGERFQTGYAPTWRAASGWALPYTNEFLRVDSVGDVTHRFSPAKGVAVECALGGSNAATLFLCCAMRGC